MRTSLLKNMVWTFAAALSCATASAQGGWAIHSEAHRSEIPASAPKAISEDVLYVSYVHGDYNNYIWQGDGYSFNENTRVGAGILFTKEMLSRYKGGKIVALSLGWNGQDPNTFQDVPGHFEAFLSKGINGASVATVEKDVRFGWNILELETPYEIDGTEDLFAGYYTEVSAGMTCIPTLLAAVQPHTCYLRNAGEDVSDGSEEWYDYAAEDSKPLAIRMVVEDPDGRFSVLAVINSVKAEQIVTVDEKASAMVSVFNAGVENISSVEISTRFGDRVESDAVSLSRGITFDETNTITLPVNVMGSGDHYISLTKINGKDVPDPVEFKMNLVGVPAEVSARYTPHFLLEWFVSENNYKSPSYTDEILIPSLGTLEGDYTLVCQHSDDQFMTGENDDALELLIDYAANDSSQVGMPCQMINRTQYYDGAALYDLLPGTPAEWVLYSPAAEAHFKEALARPTFAAVDANATLEGDKVKIEVSGDVAGGILPEEEPLYLTVYLMENDVNTDSQIFWADKGEAGETGDYVHPNVIRETVTPFRGQALKNNSGAFSETFEVDVDPSWNKANLGVVAFVGRGLANGNFSAQVLNSTSVPVIDPTGIAGISEGPALRIESRDGSFHSDKGAVEVYASDGRRVANSHLKAGMYIVKVVSDGQALVRKVIVK